MLLKEPSTAEHWQALLAARSDPHMGRNLLLGLWQLTYASVR